MRTENQKRTIEQDALILLNKGIALKEIENKFNCVLIAFKDINNIYKSVTFWGALK